LHLPPGVGPEPVRVVFMGVWEELSARAAELAVRTLLAIAVAAVIILAGRLVRPLVRRGLNRAGRPSRTRVFTALYTFVVVVCAVLVALTLAFPSVRVVDVLASLGIVSVAVGFAFKDVLENLLAGVLLLLRDPFRSGDQIRVGSHSGTVEGISVRETLLRTFDGDRVLIPNAAVYTSVLEVSTHYPVARIAFRLNLPADTDLPRAVVAIRGAISTVARPDAPDSDVVLVGIDRGALELEVRLWTGSRRDQRTATTDAALTQVIDQLAKAGISLDEPRAVLLHPSDTVTNIIGTDEGSR
jgi:small-conductance mechanosensitive channel